MPSFVQRSSDRRASLRRRFALLGLLLIASLPPDTEAASRQPASPASSGAAASDDLITRDGRPLVPRGTASTQVVAHQPTRPVRYAMPSVPQPEQSLLPERAPDRPMTTLEYAATLRPPLGKLNVSSSYGLRLHPLARRELFHHGIDYAAPSGTPIRAAQDGRIQDMSGQKGFGHVVRVRHEHGVETVYGHMLKFMPGLKKGALVRRGEIIGFVGNTGRSTGPHLHFEVLANGRQVDPMQLTIAFASDRLLSLR